MAKKTHRPNIPEATLERARRQLGDLPPASAPTQATAPGDTAQPRPQPRAQLSSADLRAEYAYVVSDLQSMGILAAVFLAVLIVLSIII